MKKDDRLVTVQIIKRINAENSTGVYNQLRPGLERMSLVVLIVFMVFLNKCHYYLLKKGIQN